LSVDLAWSPNAVTTTWSSSSAESGFSEILGIARWTTENYNVSKTNGSYFKSKFSFIGCFFIVKFPLRLKLQRY
jgi:hypothetical protein